MRWNEGGEDDVSGGGAFTHMTLLAENTAGHAQPVPAVLAGPAWRASSTSPAPTGSCSTTYAEGLIATTGCPSGEIQTWLRIGNYDKAPRQRRRVPGHLRQGQLLPRADGPRPRHRDPGPRRPAPARPATSDLPMVATNDLHYTQRRRRRRARGAAVRAVRQDDGRPEPVQVRRRRLLPQVAGRDALAVGRQVRPARGLRQHPADRRALPTSTFNESRQLHAAVPGARRGDRGVLVRQGGRARACTHRYPGRHPGRGPQAGRLRGRRHRPDGLPRLLPGRRRLHQLGQGERHPGRPGPRLRRRLAWPPTRCGSPTSTRCGTG